MDDLNTNTSLQHLKCRAKIAYPTRQLAKKGRKNIKCKYGEEARKMRPYKCALCGYYHLASINR